MYDAVVPGCSFRVVRDREGDLSLLLVNPCNRYSMMSQFSASNSPVGSSFSGIKGVFAVTRMRTVLWSYSLDFNEKCPNVGYLLDFLRQVKEKTPAGFDRIQYIEQPTARDLKAHRTNVMHEASKLRPVVIDESLTDLENLLLARETGYTGAALKACKGQTQALLMAAAAQKYKMFLCVQDLTCPGASLIQSAGLAAHIPGVAAIEANARQYFPAANKPWEARFPGVFTIRGGVMNTGILNRPGLSAV